ncbi:hypothetical protein I5I01_gp87 [Mycobacterium phage MooMoo]|uniref:Uncharacterized protein n=1 Tax=Mycobacterium phage MooMoo TaxID=2108127 RepID=A0A2P1JRG6_9CAUD|nr:hypothetical protein I5I01_gp87 [Mycobacterium phage MooMoo]AVO21692.1 hypothetical protein SEA_MOOMOO_87 [Mycobacterium phage MooMoo]
MTQPAEDGNLPAAKTRFANAISALIDPKPANRALDDGTHRIEWLDSLYDQLIDAIPGGQGNATRVPQSSPPICIDATELKQKIDTTTAQWEPRPNIDISQETPPIAIIRLKSLEERQWRPQDAKPIEQMATEIEAWCEAIKGLLNPAPRWHLPNPCPACNKAVVYRRNSAEEVVRQPALQIGAAGCVCQNCHTTWGPEYFQHLAKVLGYELPAGVLE